MAVIRPENSFESIIHEALQEKTAMLNGFHNLQKFKITSGIIHTASESTGTTTFRVCSKFETSSVFFAFPALLYSEIIETEEWKLPETDENPERASLTANEIHENFFAPELAGSEVVAISHDRILHEVDFHLTQQKEYKEYIVN